MVLDFFFPKKCLGCSKSGGYLCEQCWSKLQFQHEQICPYCEKDSLEGKAHFNCLKQSCLSGNISVLKYSNPLSKRILHQFKYAYISDLKTLIGQIIYKYLSTNNKITSFTNFIKSRPVIIPIPLHKKRQSWRGFNQSELISKEIAKYFDLKVNNNCLYRKKETLPQVDLRRKQRKENIKGVFRVDKSNPLENKKVLLIDDVWTTGSTLREAAKSLRGNFDCKVWSFTLCR